MSSNHAGEGAGSDVVACRAKLSVAADDPYCAAEFYCEADDGHGGSHFARGVARDLEDHERTWEITWQ